MTDYTAAVFATDAPKSNRFGDCDDTLMFTAKAGSSWFTGQVPRYIVSPPVGSNPPDPTPVMITSQLAEIAVFARPIKTAASPATQTFDDIDGNGFPDGFRLHYRALLIRPDLNLGTGTTRSLYNMSIPSSAEAPTTMATYYAYCDLSMHRAYDGNPNVNDLIVANSLEDLADPANRFAHYQYSLAGQGTQASCTMPLLVLEPLNSTELTVFSTGPYADPNPAFPPARLQLRGSVGNFLAPEYVLGDTREGEDVIANNILAFDIKGYDPGAPVIAIPGVDGNFGVSNSGIAGQDGSDDIVLTPNDPGYASAFNGTTQTVGYGEYVDLMWARKVLYSLKGSSVPSGLPLASALSGMNNSTTFSDGILRSGKVYGYAMGTSNQIFILQPTFDTWTTGYESNGTIQTRMTSPDFGTIDVNAMVRKNGWATQDIPSITADRGTDGIDNDSSGGVDDMAERETLPPFPTKLRGIKISVRIEDISTRQIKQMSVANEFATQ